MDQTPTDQVIASYKGIKIRVHPTELRDGGWNADFTLQEDIGSTMTETPYYGQRAYPTRELAKQAALESARRVIDEKH
jgi:hypothetical protein